MKKALFITTIFASVGFLNPMQLFSEQLTKLFFYLCVFIGAVMAVVDGQSLRNKSYPAKPYFVLLTMIVISTFSATAFHSQSYRISLMATLPYFIGYFYFWIIMRLEIPEKFVLKSIFIACAVAVPVYFINLFLFPNIVFGTDIEEDLSRGILRVPLLFLEFIVFVLFYAINQLHLKTDYRKIWICVIVMCFIMIFLSVVRQVILYSIVLGLFFILKKMSWLKKIAILAAGIFIILYVLPMIPAYNTMVELSQSQIEENEDTENVRIGAWRYYTFENQTNDITPVIGNGVPSIGNSLWGNMFESEIDSNGYFYDDISWAGMIYLFGWIAFIALFILILKTIMLPKPPNKEYLTYWFVFIAFSGIGTGVLTYYHQIFYVMIGMYLVYKDNYNESDRNYNIEL